MQLLTTTYNSKALCVMAPEECNNLNVYGAYRSDVKIEGRPEHPGNGRQLELAGSRDR